ncbi:MAG: FtsX-like permease family protein [Candidatus Marinimicrobia bacterium]|jgi:putative ABC transport system permease protein|nr:FtsX-like permease family protein [Candidatus Neomarinimicrobiota bacterium]MBT3617763.1 FtsX-like permease family protein [Candidatus Neomarinimicrobiota bacterium]MBT3828362.1 FtsX-like permease family protein [Candidatus Neomarinimicrobiota bacterium]MBT3997584.1 FtsX-like permease family protein [Candidatus Neomarinimicrobiota bacterium]MBT4280745.1 FtsX-like permease family protein [Candidatus Neomarinimicrobiota bacterium]
MLKFVLKGIIRDRSRSLFPIIVVSLIVALVIFNRGFLVGTMNGMFRDTAVISSGHVKIMTRAYQEESQLMPNDLALMNVGEISEVLSSVYSDYFWSPRITFAGLLDLPDEQGETKSQGPIMSYGIDFLSSESRQYELWELEKRIVLGRMIQDPREALVGHKLADKLGLSLGDHVTYIGTTMNNAFTTFNFTVVGTFNLGMGPLDKQMVLVDIEGARLALDMENAASELLGFTHDLYYDDDASLNIRDEFNAANSDTSDIFRSSMIALRDTNQMGTMIDLVDWSVFIILGIFLLIAMIVLWNMGIMSGLRRYGEIGVRLAMGETKGQVYRSLILESVIIGTIGTIIGTIIGLPLTYYVQEVGMDYSAAFENLNTTTMIMSSVFYTKVTPDLYYIGIIPGVLATVLGTMLAGRAIYKREMAQLFKELET